MQFTTNFLGQASYYTVDQKGFLQQDIALSSPGANFIITKGTQALDKDGNPFRTLTINEVSDYPDPPADSNILAIPLDLGPDGATFSPAITAFFNYDPELLPRELDENDLSVAFYDEATGSWIVMPCEIMPGNGQIKVMIDHFCIYAILYPKQAPATVGPTSTATDVIPTVTFTLAPTTEPVTTIAPTQEPSATSPTQQTTLSTTPTSHTQPAQSNSSSPIWYVVGAVVVAIGIIAVIYIRRYTRWM